MGAPERPLTPPQGAAGGSSDPGAPQGGAAPLLAPLAAPSPSPDQSERRWWDYPDDSPRSVLARLAVAYLWVFVGAVYLLFALGFRVGTLL